jgi:hypothetical protein
MRKIASYYKQEKNTYLIELELNNIYQLFNSFDPSPFLEKDLDDNAENYIVQSVSEFSLKTSLKLVLYLSENSVDKAIDILPDAIHHYFSYRKQNAEKELRAIFRLGRTSLTIGITFLFICITLSELIARFKNETLVRIFQEGLLILGWVAMWKPLEIFLYDWWSIYNRQKIFDKLSHIEIDIRPKSN